MMFNNAEHTIPFTRPSISRRFLPALIMLIGILSGCAGRSPSQISAPPTKTAYPFVTATPEPTSTPVTPTATITPLPTLTPVFTMTPTEGTPGVTVIPSIEGPTSTPTITPEPVCDYHPDDMFGFTYDLRPDFASKLGCLTIPDDPPPPAFWPVNIRYQPMERGYMIWMSNIGWYEGRVIYALFEDGSYIRYEDTFILGVDPPIGGPEPPEELFRPEENLNKLWRTVPGLIERLGFATEPELHVAAQMQLFQYGEMLNIEERSTVFALWRSGDPGWVKFTFGTLEDITATPSLTPTATETPTETPEN